jgi:RES domain-containing protein
MGSAGLTKSSTGFTRQHFIAHIKKIHLSPLQGDFFRMVLEAHADSIEETGPSFMIGGRYNIAGEFGALYLAESPELCWQEKLTGIGA